MKCQLIGLLVFISETILTFLTCTDINVFKWGLIILSRIIRTPAAELIKTFIQINSLRPRQNRRHFPDDIFKSILLNESIWISFEISPKFVPKGPINNNPSLVQIMACSRQASSHFLNQWWLVYWRIYASLGLNELNSLAPGRFDYNLKLVNFKLLSMKKFLSIFCEIVIRWMPHHLTDHKSTLIQVMTWCRQATSHYLSQCWSKSLSPHYITRPQWIKECVSQQVYWHIEAKTKWLPFYRQHFLRRTVVFWFKLNWNLFPRVQLIS